jgi:hypothetical protein
MSDYLPPGMPSRADVDSMARILRIMNGETVEPEPVRMHGGQTVNNPIVVTQGPTSADTAAMAKILEAFRGATEDTAVSLREEAARSPRMQEAMATVATPTGAIIDKWEVRARVQESASSGKQRKIYDVMNPRTREVVAEKLVIYEAAFAIVRLLNKGHAANSSRVQEVLTLEETFHRNRQDAARFKQRFERCKSLGEKEAGDVFEARYQRARAEALVAHDQVKSILESIR